MSVCLQPAQHELRKPLGEVMVATAWNHCGVPSPQSKGRAVHCGAGHHPNLGNGSGAQRGECVGHACLHHPHEGSRPAACIERDIPSGAWAP